jgi:hypothetical protein
MLVTSPARPFTVRVGLVVMVSSESISSQAAELNRMSIHGARWQPLDA